MIELSNISKIFDTGFNQVNALSDIDVKIDQGEFVAIKLDIPETSLTI